MNRFTDKIVLITGGTSGMGLATAHRLIAEGAHVIITGRTSERVDAAVKELGPNASGVVSDASAPRAVDTLVETVREDHGRLDSLFANAGVGTFLPFEEITEADFDHSVGINLKGVFFTVQKALPLLVEGSSIVINASWTLYRGNSPLTLYSATKAAAHNLAGRFGRPEEIATAVAFLASSEASYVNGQDLVIDGGLVGAIPA